MSNTLYAFMKSESVPGRAALQSWIEALGFDLRLHEDLELRTNEGFSPCVLEGVEDIGFELASGSTREMADGDDEILQMAGARDFCLSMSWRGSMSDCAAASIVGCALAKHCDAVISYEGEAPEPLEKLLEATNGILEEVRTENAARRKTSGKKLDRRVVRQRFADVLVPHGFSCEGKNGETFHRELPGQIFHFVAPRFDRREPTYDVMVFFSSPLIDPDFQRSFPEVWPPSATCHLRPGHGIERDGSRFGCKDTKTFEEGFEKVVRGALTTIAIPYLDRVRTLEDMIPLTTDPGWVQRIEQALKS